MPDILAGAREARQTAAAKQRQPKVEWRWISIILAMFGVLMGVIA